MENEDNNKLEPQKNYFLQSFFISFILSILIIIIFYILGIKGLDITGLSIFINIFLPPIINVLIKRFVRSHGDDLLK